MGKIKLGIIGCGHWGPNFIRNFTNLKEAEVSIICDINKDKIKQLKKSYPKIKTCTNYQQIISDKFIQAVIVSTPAFTHYEIVKKALNAKKHVLSEKPLALKGKEAQELIDISKKVKRILMVGHTFLYNSAIHKIKEILKNKELGKICYIHSRRTNLGPLRKDVDAIWDLSPHDISIVNYLLDQKPIDVSAHGQRFLHHKLDDVGFINLRYPKNILFHIHVSWLDPKKVREMTIIGTKKMLVYNDIDTKEPIKIYDKKVMKKSYDKEYSTFKEFQLIIKEGKTKVPKVKPTEPLKAECQHFVDCLLEKKNPFTDGENGLEVLKVIEAISSSIFHKGKFIKV